MKWSDNLRNWDRFKVYRYVILLGLSLSGDGWSYEASVIASIIQLPAWIKHLGYDTAIPDSKNQWIGPVYSLGQLVGGLIAAFFLDTFGRKPTMVIGALLMELSTALLVWSYSFGVVIAARIIEGVSIGFLLLGYQIYAVEIAAKEDRGFVSSFTLMTGNFFGLLAAGIVYGISYSTSNAGWRVALGVTFIPATLLLMILPWVPESPRYLYEKGKYEQCRKVLGKLHGCTHEDGHLVLSDAGETEYEAMRAAITWDQQHGQDKWAALWNSKAARYRSFVAISSQSWWAWNGGSIFTYYYTIVFSAAGITDPHVQFGISGVQNASWCLGGIVGGYLLDVWGRRTNYLIGTGQAAFMLIIQGGLALGIFDKGIVNHAAGAGFVSVYIIQWFLWVMFFSPVVNMLPAEIYSAGLRARGYAIANVFSMGVGFATQYSALPMYRHMHGWVWIFFACCMLFAFTVIYFTYPETKGLTLEEVEVVFGTGAGQRVKEALGHASPVDPRTPLHFQAQRDIEDEERKVQGMGSTHTRTVSSTMTTLGDEIAESIASDGEDGYNELDLSYEQERLENIKNNAALLASLGLNSLVAKSASSSSGGGAISTFKKNSLSSEELRRRREIKAKEAAARRVEQPTRRSSRVAAKVVGVKLEDDDPLTPKHNPIPRATAPTLAPGPTYSRSPSSEPRPSAPKPTRAEDGRLIFEGRWKDVFTPNLTPEEMFRGGAFGGGFFADTYSQILREPLLSTADLLSLPFTLPRSSTLLTNPEPSGENNRWRVRAGQSLQEWEKAGWIWKGDPRGWAQWYVRFWEGRRCEDDERQVRRWLKVAGPTGRFKRALLKKLHQAGGISAVDDEDVAPVLRQCLWQWGYELNKDEFEGAMRGE
ncbi:hypothetical protein CI109_105010 [Kwoniella shandongensis]|uniref:Major facilitator superfamily (MFS) profile domain-containing protein n=1 Tax=Kwoniella shandongensis TaxID=1734106 RepID=A0AAJ8LNU7_9TREE